jgi:hypothetical protein
MAHAQKNVSSNFPTVYCTKLVVCPDTTDLKWSFTDKHPDIDILGPSDTAKTSTTATYERGILASQGFVVGTNIQKWYLDINIPSTIHVGMALLDQDLTTTVGALVHKTLDVTSGDIVRFSLTAGSTLTVKHEKKKNITITNVYDLTGFTGQTVYPWVSSMGIMSVRIMYDNPFNIYVDSKGSVHMNGQNNEIVDFSLDDIIENNGGSGVSGGTSIANGSSSVTVENGGNININGGVNYKCENITDPVSSVTLQLDDFAVLISNPLTTSVFLPSVSVAPCQYYSIIRNYPVQIGEIWTIPVLSIVADGVDTIEGLTLCGIPPDSNIQVMSDGLFTWKIM